MTSFTSSAIPTATSPQLPIVGQAEQQECRSTTQNGVGEIRLSYSEDGFDHHSAQGALECWRATRGRAE
jgi:hypothetical protein